MGGSTSSKLFDAIDEEDVEKVNKILSKRPELINHELRKHCPYGPLTRAVWRGDLNMVNYLIEEMGADVNKQCNFSPKLQFFLTFFRRGWSCAAAPSRCKGIHRYSQIFTQLEGDKLDEN